MFEILYRWGHLFGEKDVTWVGDLRYVKFGRVLIMEHTAFDGKTTKKITKIKNKNENEFTLCDQFSLECKREWLARASSNELLEGIKKIDMLKDKYRFKAVLEFLMMIEDIIIKEMHRRGVGYAKKAA